MKKLALLDCTLRDGGYVNNWNFGERTMREIFSALVDSRIEFIEAGFLCQEKNIPGRTRFSSIESMSEAFPRERGATRVLAMIVFGKFPIEKIPPQKETAFVGIRVTFKKNERVPALAFCKKLKELGYLVSVNPTGADGYSDREFLEVVAEVNELNPFAFAIVDTLGAMKRRDVSRLCSLIDHNLAPGIALCFHSHNNLQLSFANALEVMNVTSNRLFIIDVSCFGMGRGAGNLCTELMMRHINDRVPEHYDMIPVLKIIDERISRIFAETPWGYSVPYYLAAVNRCHPNYAAYLQARQTLPVTEINFLLKLIPESSRNEYSEKIIETLYRERMTHTIDDSAVVETLKSRMTERNILLLAPGKSLETHADSVSAHIAEKSPVVIAVNVAPPAFNVDFLFISNPKRFADLHAPEKTPLILTSNIRGDIPENAFIINYSSYLNDSELSDNASLMLLSLLVKLGCKNVALAGLDGFSSRRANDYFSGTIANSGNEDFAEQNKNLIMSEQLSHFAKKIPLTWITPSAYRKDNPAGM